MSLAEQPSRRRTSGDNTHRTRSVGGGIALAILSLILASLAVLMAVGEIGYYRTYGCFFSGFNIFDVCGDSRLAGHWLFILGEVLVLVPAALVGWKAFRRFRPGWEDRMHAPTQKGGR